ncbi:uncharacterized protein HMPREF1541_06549 [Cyphellophora europaea CBS 101466]|uniref:Sm domain-containing protein n=1 Tax=Cyphellophora europaea (strain CBS 101466) TaxID=1220924 RepID=W2RS30_CYPE1|nr:uncharacterized protein HMPREF1541_06549 [Cyphellophora europaea CBS 101466]ETN38514.1 hypothetical protein HMPREF1541_06549 [Cyphellophora europaea CBS 101466]
MVSPESTQFLTDLLGKTLHITVVDGRLFTGCFRCTDNETNVVLSNTFEYRKPSAKEEAKAIEEAAQSGKPVKADMTSRFLGLVTVGKEQIVKIELEERRTGAMLEGSLPTRSKG